MTAARWVMAAFLAVPFRLVAQTVPIRVVPASPTLSVLVGVAVDSLHGGFLGGAMVQLVGTGRAAVTDSTGRFRIDSVPPGRYQLALFHPVLDTIGMTVTSQPIEFPAGRLVAARLGVPSATSVAAALCPRKLITGPGVLVGRVEYADSDAVAAGAKVQMVWSRIEVGTAVGLHRGETVREATVDATGGYRICGVPSTLTGTIRAKLNGVSTAEVPVAFSGDTVRLVSLNFAGPQGGAPVALPPSSPVAVAPSPGKTAPVAAQSPAPPLMRGVAVVSGRVVTSGGRPVAGADVSVVGAAGRTLTDSDGAFTLRGLPTGTQSLVVRKIGLAEQQLVVELSSRAPQAVVVTVRSAPPRLAAITVVGKREEELKKVGFTDRQKTGLGHYLTEEQIAAANPQHMTDVFSTMPGITLDYSGGGGDPNITGSRTAGGGCVNYYIDDMPYRPGSGSELNQYMQPSELAAVEVYNASDVPSQYESTGSSSCTTIVMWTKTRIGG